MGVEAKGQSSLHPQENDRWIYNPLPSEGGGPVVLRAREWGKHREWALPIHGSDARNEMTSSFTKDVQVEV